MIRQFKLRNEYSQEYSLSVPAAAFLYEPEGLGYEMDCSYLRLGYSWVRNYMKDAQQEITGSVVFTAADPYSANADFLRFIRRSAKLTLVYTTSVGEYLRDVDLVSYEKTEITEGNVLECPIKLKARGLWYSNNVTRFSVEISSDDDAKIYDYEFPYKYQGIVNGETTVYNDGSVSAPFRASFMGPIANPKVILLVNGSEQARVEITGEAQLGQTIEYSSVDGDLYCYLDAAGVQTNLVSGLNINYDNFFKIPVGESVLRFEADAQITQPIIVTVQKLFRAV